MGFPTKHRAPIKATTESAAVPVIQATAKNIFIQVGFKFYNRITEQPPYKRNTIKNLRAFGPPIKVKKKYHLFTLYMKAKKA